MNDRYLYRAKRTDNGEWIVGNRIDDGVTGQVFIHAAGNTVNESDKVGEDGCLRFVAFEVDPSTICQCTGLKDKNGKLIWENDIVKEFNSSGDEWNLSQIVFGEYSLNLGWCTKGIKTLHEYNRRLFNVGFGTSEAGKCEVIGSAIDNPELLEVGE